MLFDEFLVAIGMVRDVLMYLDKTMRTDTHKDMLQCFTVLYRKHSPLAQVVNLVRMHRAKMPMEPSHLKNAVEMMHMLEHNGQSIYILEFEPALIRETIEYYASKRREWLQESCTEYFNKTKKVLEAEEMWIEWLSSGSQGVLTDTLLGTLIYDPLDDLLAMPSGPIYMFQNDSVEILALVYDYLGRVHLGHERLVTALGCHIDTLMPAPPQDRDKQGPIDWIEYFVALIEKSNRLTNSCFHNDLAFQTGITARIQSLINSEPKAAEFLAIYIDDNLRKQRQELAVFTDKTLLIFKFLVDKDLFARYYKKLLAKRLLSKQVHQDAEECMIAKMKGESGAQFTFQLQGMFHDVSLSTDIAAEFKAKSKILVVTVLTATFWPAQSIPLDIPVRLSQELEKFNNFYLSKHTGRRLDWVYSMGNADLVCRFKAGEKVVNLSTFGMIVLVGHFNDCDSASFAEIQEKSGIPKTDLVRTLLSLSMGKHKLLLTSLVDRKITADSVFAVNMEFSSPLAKIKIAHLVNVDTEERKETLEQVMQDRKHVVEACIVRIMKSRQALAHNLLIAQVFEQLIGFKPTPAFIKQRIQGLIEREYLERNSEDLYIFLTNLGILINTLLDHDRNSY